MVKDKKKVPDKAEKKKFSRRDFLTVGGAKGKRNFEGILLTVRYFFDALNIDFTDHLLFKEIDQKGEIKNHPTALEDARSLAKQLVSSQQ